ncbi:MAG: MoxR family ATPase [Clostridiales bacterium]|nr:MoxR family ATPase [Clostridiales bacterium]
MNHVYRTLEEQGIAASLIRDLQEFHRKYSIPENQEVRDRIMAPTIQYFGKDILEMAMAAILQGENLLLSGSKATGKNVLAENLAWIFQRPLYSISFHVNTDSSSLIGTDTFRNQEVQFRQGPICQCAEYGGFGVLDEINMAKNDAVSVLHATLDYRRIIDIPGYHRIHLHDAARFIGTMNYGYAGTRELNEALVSRFLVIDMPDMADDTLDHLIREMFPAVRKEAKNALIGLFMDLQLKAKNGEISTKPLDLRGFLASIRLMKAGVSPYQALRMGLVNKSFDLFEKEIVEDIVAVRISEDWDSNYIFPI